MTNQFDPFSLLDSKFFVGYEPMVKRFDEISKTISKSIPNYPPYNIVKVDENKYVIEMAVAGFGKQNLDVEINDGTLTIVGKTDTDQDGNYLYKGIADRAFKRVFNISDTIEIKNAELFNGMLKIWLENIIPDSKKPKKVDITDTADAKPTTSKTLLNEDAK
ncbi:IbpA Molecular chaperone (small heat shock protein) [uncultured Caudovirales phage]|uniref:IbpA Molecular chaperone (Small heat shock protein) n=1 Tax=uncultured Caudovirales phage TaxID=2100421 RepID=A0A6J7WXX8_9CAUD|nr:IbpA Molecular chaperone (small heat shock protein) [uncultured Caudovirales phage]